MRKYIFILFFPLLVLTACSVGRTAESRAMENEAYLQFVTGEQIYMNGVEVYVDNNSPFTAKTDKVDSRTVKGNTYVIKSGKRHLKVVANNQVVYEKDIVVSSQETRKIQLP